VRPEFGSRRKSDIIAEHIGAFLREAAVLLGVFIPLDFLVTDKTLTRTEFWSTVAAVIVFLSVGIYIDVRRQ
jgi:hypothetical protein